MFLWCKAIAVVLREKKTQRMDANAFWEEIDGMLTKVSPFERLLKKRKDERRG